ncbi:MAG: hypothetical protein EA379_00870 [Phycisphaerales bacterium]|nr:MAG: hypothetical protein EA379_00870 [Phycisphaerales bacterium]
MQRSVVITGLGAVTPFGVGAHALWEGLLRAESRLAPIERFDASGFPCRLAAETRDFHAKDHVPKSYRKAVKVMARDIELAVGAALDATRDAAVRTRGVLDSPDEPTTYPAARMGCHIGAGLIAAEADELARALATARDERGAFDPAAWGDGAMNNLQPLWLLKYLPNMLACHVTIIHDTRGPSNTITCAEASGALSIGESMRVIQRNDADLCFTGGAESKINVMGLLRMDLAGRLAHTGDETDGANVLRPYDPDAPGGLLGEGAGILIIEAEETANTRGATPYARLAGFGAGAAPITGDLPRRAQGLVNAIERALDDAGATPDDVDAVVPLACGAPGVDELEAHALRATLGTRLKDLPLITITPNIGNAMAGVGALQACAAALALKHQTVPARIHRGATPADLRAGPEAQRDARLRSVLVCTPALGGQNAALLLRAMDQ